MSNDQINGFKQFFVTTLDAKLDAALEPIRADIKLIKGQIEQLQTDVIQLFARVEQLQEGQKSLGQEMTDGFVAIGEAIERIFRQDDQREDLIS